MNEFEEFAKNMNGNQYKTMADQVTDVLRKAILEGTLKPGKKLRSEEISNYLNVSRMPVREAFRKLEAEGIITFVPYKGAIVSKYYIREIIELIQVRSCLETFAFEVAFTKLTPDNIAELEELVHESEKETDINHKLELFNTFSNILFQIAGNSEMYKMIYQVRSRYERYLKICILNNKNVVNEIYESQRKMLDYVKEGHNNEALEIFNIHLNNLKNEIICCIKKFLKENATT